MDIGWYWMILEMPARLLRQPWGTQRPRLHKQICTAIPALRWIRRTSLLRYSICFATKSIRRFVADVVVEMPRAHLTTIHLHCSTAVNHLDQTELQEISRYIYIYIRCVVAVALLQFYLKGWITSALEQKRDHHAEELVSWQKALPNREPLQSRNHYGPIPCVLSASLHFDAWIFLNLSCIYYIYWMDQDGPSHLDLARSWVSGNRHSPNKGSIQGSDSKSCCQATWKCDQ